MIDLFSELNTEGLIRFIKNKYNPNKPIFLGVDLFCGCGGVTEGYSKAENLFIVACVNHDPYAIKSHEKNHPYCIHYTEDIREWVVVFKIQSLINKLRIVFPDAIVLLHASLECTHFSKAKGGLSRDADSRTLANHLYKYLIFKPDYITIENVEEFLSWGPVDSKGKPIQSKKGIDYENWIRDFQNKGFKYEYQILNAADFGAYTSRKRYFGIFASNGLPITFPKQTHISKNKVHLNPTLKPHKAVKEKLNLHIEGNSLFGLNLRGKPYVEATFERVYHGLIKFYNEGYFTIRYNGGCMKEKSKSINNAFATILTGNVHGLVKPIFITSYYGASKNGQGVHSLEVPCNTIATKDTFALHHLQYAYGKPTFSKLSEPSQAITTTPKQELITTKWLFDTQFNRVGNSINKPAPTIIARQDKKPIYLASTTNSFFIDNSIEVPGDSEIKQKLRKFMRENGITDIKIRSLQLDELKRIQGFPENYILEGGKTRAMKYIGNSVVPEMAEALANAIIKGFNNHKKQVV